MTGTVFTLGPRSPVPASDGGGRGGASQRLVVGADHLAVLHAGDPLGGGGDVVVVGDHEDRLAALVEAAEQLDDLLASLGVEGTRSEERRVGKECRSRWSRDR